VSCPFNVYGRIWLRADAAKFHAGLHWSERRTVSQSDAKAGFNQFDAHAASLGPHGEEPQSWVYPDSAASCAASRISQVGFTRLAHICRSRVNPRSVGRPILRDGRYEMLASRESGSACALLRMRRINSHRLSSRFNSSEIRFSEFAGSAARSARVATRAGWLDGRGCHGQRAGRNLMATMS
jgi:hypothetical protein